MKIEGRWANYRFCAAIKPNKGLGETLKATVLQLMNNLALYVTGPLCHRGHRARNHPLPTPLAPPLSIGRCKLAIYISISRRNIAARNLANRLPRSDTRCYITCTPIKTTWNAFNHFRKFVRLIRSPISSPRFAIQTRQ